MLHPGGRAPCGSYENRSWWKIFLDKHCFKFEDFFTRTCSRSDSFHATDAREKVIFESCASSHAIFMDYSKTSPDARQLVDSSKLAMRSSGRVCPPSFGVRVFPGHCRNFWERIWGAPYSNLKLEAPLMCVSSKESLARLSLLACRCSLLGIIWQARQRVPRTINNQATSSMRVTNCTVTKNVQECTRTLSGFVLTPDQDV